MKITVLYEDNHLIAVAKPAGMLVQGDDTNDTCLMDEVKTYIKETYGKPGNVFLGLVHRLDRPVAGVVLFAKTSKGASRISEQIRDHTVKKVYHALVEGIPKETEQTLIHYLKKNEKTNMVTVYSRETPGSLRAELSYRVVQSGAKASIVRVELVTGRPHQIRSQLAYIGSPIVGDKKYGSTRVYKPGAIALASTSFTFRLATTDEIKTVEMPIPSEWKTYLN